MKRLYSLDAIRGLAALTIVLWHWQHFFALTGQWQPVWNRDWQPFYRLLEPLYLTSWAAVDLFFALSGFVFFWLYGEAIREGKVKPFKFAWLRISRLWPLQALMLIVIALLQWGFRSRSGVDFIFPADDIGRFFAHLFMVHQTVPPNIIQTFNGPAWTVSIEVALYVLFFILCRLGLNGWRTALVVVLIGLPLFHIQWFISRGLMGFFLGGLAYFAVEKIRLMASARRVSQIVCLLCLAVWAVIWVEIEYGPMHAFLDDHTDWLPDDWSFYNEGNDDIFHVAYILTAVPLTVAALALSEAVLNLFPRFYKKATYLGDISYSVYMLHFPLQTACALAALSLGLTSMFFMHWWVMAGFYAVLLSLASLSFFYFEKPMQKWMRGLVEKKPAE